MISTLFFGSSSLAAASSRTDNKTFFVGLTVMNRESADNLHCCAFDLTSANCLRSSDKEDKSLTAVIMSRRLDERRNDDRVADDKRRSASGL